MRHKTVSLVILLLLFTVIYPFASGETWVSVDNWDIQGIGDNIACDALGNIYVTTHVKSSETGSFYYKNFVEKYDSNGNFLTKWGGNYSEEGKGGFGRYIYGIASDGSGNVYVSDYENHLIQKFDSNGRYITQWKIDQEEYGAPFGVAVDRSGNVYVAAGNSVLKFDGSGNLIIHWEAEAREIAVSSSGYVYVTFAFKASISKFDQNGNFIAKLGGEGSGDGQFDTSHLEMSIAVDGEGNVYVFDGRSVNDPVRSRIQKFDSNGNFISKFETKFNDFAYGIAIDHSGNIYLAHLSQVLKYQIESGSSNPSLTNSPTSTQSPTPSPSVPEFPLLVIAMSLIVVSSVALAIKKRYGLLHNEEEVKR
jgi:tripartite motif-containing protein 71